MKRSIIGKCLVLALLLLALGMICSGCGKKIQIVDENNRDITTGKSDTSDSSTTGGATNAMSQFRDEHKYTFQLMRFTGNIGRLETEPTTTPLTQQQAKQVLTLLQPLRAQTTLSQDQAKDALRGLKSVLTELQLTQVGAMKSPQNAMGRQGGQGGGAQGGGQGGGQQGNRPRMQFDPAAMKDFNPFNPPKDSPMASGRQAARWEALFTDLEAKASGKSMPPPGAPGAHGGHMHYHHGGGPGGGSAPDNGGNAPAPQ